MPRIPLSFPKYAARGILLAGVALPLAGLPPLAQGQETPPQDLAAATSLTALFERQVQGADGEALGEIEDVLINDNDPLSPYALISVGGIAGIGDRLVAVPLADMTRTAEGNLVYPETEEVFLAKPTYRRPQSPMTGALAPGKERSQEAQGVGDPSQPTESVPGAYQEEAGGPKDDAQKASADRPPTTDILLQDIPYETRDRYMGAARQALDTWQTHLAEAELSAEEAQRVDAMLATASTRVDRLSRATDENWPALRDNAAAIFGKISAFWEDASPQTASQPAVGHGNAGADR